jgi:transcriptional regulator with XRE-family HTH domain
MAKVKKGGLKRNRTSFGEWLVKFREGLGLSQVEFSKPLGWHNQYISNIERGICGPSEELVSAIIAHYQADKEKVIKVLKKDFEVCLRKKIGGK